jgi:hypothetical protein
MATDYDAPRKSETEIADEHAETLAVTQSQKSTTTLADPDEANLGDDLELPGADLSDQALEVHVVPVQADEFTCGACHLVRHASQNAGDRNGRPVCADCA